MEGDRDSRIQCSITRLMSTWHSRNPPWQVKGILAAVPLALVAFDEVEHDPEQVRLLVVARKPSGE
jgi:hypothetical protein